ncbi:uroporphyrinogen-III synthase [soil metagenome]
MTRFTHVDALTGCYVISLRPVGGHAALRRAAALHSARVLALSPWRLVGRDDAGTRAGLHKALAIPRVVFTSPAAVRAASNLQVLQSRNDQVFIGFGDGTARALRRAGASQVTSPSRMDSEGVLALPVLREVQGRDVGLVTAPGGRGRIATALAGRGARVLRADVYARVAVEPPARAVACLQRLQAPLLLALSSGEALERILELLPEPAVARLRQARVLAASDRLARLARELGFTDLVVANDARPASLLSAAVGAARAGAG